MESVSGLEKKIEEGYRPDYDEALSLMRSLSLEDLCALAHALRLRYQGKRVDMCSIMNARSGKCGEDCKWCSQSRFHHTDIEVYPLVDAESALREAVHNASKGVSRFSLVTSGRTLSPADTERICAIYRRIGSECPIKLCASLGLLNHEQLFQLKESGVTRYHCNLETAPSYFPQVCTTHTIEEKLQTIEWAREAGLEICSGGIIGMGETWEDRIDMAVSLFECGVDSIPINSLMPIKGTPLENLERISEPDILRTVALFRYINPTADIRLGAGRALLTNDGELAFESGVSATITGNMLTTVACATIRSDKKMLEGIGRNVTPEYEKTQKTAK